MRLYGSFRRWQSRKRSKLQVERLLSLSADADHAVATRHKDDPLAVVQSCRDRAASVRSYRSAATIRVANETSHMEGPVQYVLEAIRPDRFHVQQSAWMDEREVYDEWITLGEDHYDNVGAWGKSLVPQRKDLNRELSLETFLGLLDTAGAHECLSYPLDEHVFLRLDADSVAPGLAQGQDSREAVTILWIDDATLLPAKVEASALFQDERLSSRQEFEQIFYDFDADISFHAPRVQIS